MPTKLEVFGKISLDIIMDIVQNVVDFGVYAHLN